MDAGYPTTRRFPRTACGADGAFQRSADYAAAIEAPARAAPSGFGLLLAAAALAILGFLAQVVA